MDDRTPEEYADWWLHSGERRCGRPTKSGSPCRNILFSPLMFTCTTHQTEQSRRMEAILRLVDREARAQSREWAVQSVRMDAQNEARSEWANRPCKHYRSKDGEGRFLIVARGYTWHSDEPVAVGDEVLLPGSEWHKPSWERVTAVESDYRGPTRGISGHREVKERVA